MKRKHRRAWAVVLFAIYIILCIYFLLLSDYTGRMETSSYYRYNLILFKEINRFWTYRQQLGFEAVFLNLAGNVLVFIPFGLIFPDITGNKLGRNILFVTFLAFSFSIIMELLQLLLKVGSFDVDDLFLNTLGGFIGICLYNIVRAVHRRRHSRAGHKK